MSDSKPIKDPFASLSVPPSIEQVDSQLPSSQNSMSPVSQPTWVEHLRGVDKADRGPATDEAHHEVLDLTLEDTTSPFEHKKLLERPRLASMFSDLRASNYPDGGSLLNRPRVMIDLEDDDMEELGQATTKAAKLSHQMADERTNREANLSAATPDRTAGSVKSDSPLIGSSREAEYIFNFWEAELRSPTTHESSVLQKTLCRKHTPAAIDLTSPTPVPEPAVETYLHSLPAELRNRIYCDVGLKAARYDLVTMDEPALAVAIPDLKEELHSIIFSENKFRVDVWTKLSPPTPLPLLRPDERDSPEPLAGQILVPQYHWMWKVNPRFINIRHISFRVRSQEDDSVLFDFFANVRAQDGQPTAKGRMSVMSQSLRRLTRPLGDLARAKLKAISTREGFEGLSWRDVQEVAACFTSAEDALSKFTKKYGKVTLK